MIKNSAITKSSATSYARRSAPGLSSQPSLQCRIHTLEWELTALADEWRELHTHAGRSPFSDYDLFHIWWRTVGKTHGVRRLHVVTARLGGRLVGVLPLTAVRRHGLWVLQAAGYKGYNYCDMLAENEEQAAALWQTARRSPHYDFASIRDVYPESMCYPALSAFARRRDENGAFRLKFGWTSGKEWLASLPKKVRHEFKRHTRRLEEKAPVRFEVYKQGPLPTRIVEDMIRRKIAWSLEREKHGIFEHPHVLTYFRQLLETAAKQDRLFLAWLKCGDDTIAYAFYLSYGNALHGYVTTYDPAWAACAPGILILINSVCWAIDNGYQALDHRQGDGHYKSRYSNEERICAEFTFCRSLTGRLIENIFVTLRALARALKLRSL